MAYEGNLGGSLTEYHGAHDVSASEYIASLRFETNRKLSEDWTLGGDCLGDDFSDRFDGFDAKEFLVQARMEVGETIRIEA